MNRWFLISLFEGLISEPFSKIKAYTKEEAVELSFGRPAESWEGNKFSIANEIFGSCEAEG